MSLSSLNLDAFVAVSRTLSFSRAARELHVTQSALSQRIKNLESELGLSLFRRLPSGTVLTDSGEKLLRYCQVKDGLEVDLLAELTSTRADELAGVIRIAGFSSIVRSVVLPALSPLLRDHPKVTCELLSREMDELLPMLQRSEVDFILVDGPRDGAGLTSQCLGRERYVLVESIEHEGRKDVYLDNDPADPMTARFWRHQTGESPTYRRAFLDDIYGVLDGTAAGIGRAVVPRHLLGSRGGLRKVPGHRPYDVEVWLHYFAQPFYPKLHRAALDALKTRCPEILK